MSERRTCVKGLVLAGGKGSRLRPTHGYRRQAACASGQQARALLQHRTADLQRPHRHRHDHWRHGRPGSRCRWRRISVRCSGDLPPQSAPLGLAHAIITAKDWLGNDSFCMFLGDNFLKRGIEPFADEFETVDVMPRSFSSGSATRRRLASQSLMRQVRSSGSSKNRKKPSPIWR